MKLHFTKFISKSLHEFKPHLAAASWKWLVTAVLKGKGAQWQEIARFARLYATYFYVDPLVL